MNPEEIKHEEVTTTNVQLTDQENERSRRLIPVAIGLGLLFIVGGIAFLNSTRHRQVADLPDYTPDMVAQTSPSPSISPEMTSSPAPVAVVEVPAASPTPQVAGSQTTKTTAKAQSSSLPQYTPQSQLSDYQPTTSNTNSESLPAYTPSSGLPDYQPQYSGSTDSTNETKQTIRVTLAVPGKDYLVNVAPGATVLDVLKAAQVKGLSFKSEYFPSYKSEMVTEINGQAQNGSHYWLYTVNGKFASKGISLQTVNEFDVIMWSLS